MDLKELRACTEEIVEAARSKDTIPPTDKEIKHLINDFGAFSKALRKSKGYLPKGYTDELLLPFLEVLEGAKGKRFKQGLALASDPELERHARLFLDIAQTILQRQHTFDGDEMKTFCTASAAADEVIADLYDGFFDDVAQQMVRAPARRRLAPLVAWVKGPLHRTWTADQAAVLGPRVPILAVPAGGVEKGLLAWAVLAHEVVGHDVLSAYDGLIDELKGKVWTSMEEAGLGDFWCEYWASRVDEAASDVMGVLSMGPAFAIALTPYLRALQAIPRKGKAKLRSEGKEEDPYPADFLRAYLVVETMALLKYNKKPGSVKELRDESEKDFGMTLRIGKRKVTPAEAVKSAAVMARTLVSTPLKCLKDSYGQPRSIGELQDWSYEDERWVSKLRTSKERTCSIASARAAGPFAAHVVAAAVMDAVEGEETREYAFKLMLDRLEDMHRQRLDRK